MFAGTVALSNLKALGQVSQRRAVQGTTREFLDSSMLIYGNGYDAAKEVVTVQSGLQYFGSFVLHEVRWKTLSSAGQQECLQRPLSLTSK